MSVVPSPNQAVELPTGQTTVVVRLINPVNFGPAILKRFMAPQVPGLDTFKNSPSFSFLLEHPSGKKLVFDLGIRKDYLNHAPKISNYLPTTGYTIEVSKNVTEILEEGDVALSQVDAVIWRFVWHSLAGIVGRLTSQQPLALGSHR
jgi:hypothetical protein